MPRPTSILLLGARRAVTLLELLIALAVMIGLLALALPFTMRMLEERELATTEESIASELLKARVRAQESGKAVEVVVLEGAPSRIAMHFFDMTSSRAESGAQDSFRVSTERDRPSASDRHRRSSGDPVRDSWWEESALDSSIRVTSSDASSDAGSGRNWSTYSDRTNGAKLDSGNGSGRRAGEGLGTGSGLGSGSGGGSLRLAVFLPDGSILFAATLLLLHDSGLRSRVSVDPWTGQPAIARGATDERPAPSSPESAEHAEKREPSELADEIDTEWSDGWRDDWSGSDTRAPDRAEDREGERGRRR